MNTVLSPLLLECASGAMMATVNDSHPPPGGSSSQVLFVRRSTEEAVRWAMVGSCCLPEMTAVRLSMAFMRSRDKR